MSQSLPPIQRLGPAISGLDTLRVPNPSHPPRTVLKREKRPLLGLIERLRAVATNPLRLFVESHRQSRGGPFALRIPFNFDLTFLPGKAGYRFVLGLPPETGKMGPVMKRVPTVGSWYPRSDPSAEHLQDLLISARSFMAKHIFTRNRIRDAEASVQTVLQRHSQRWEGNHLDLTPLLMDAIYDISAEFVVGADLWGRIAHQVSPLLRDIAEGVDISRTAICHTPLLFFTKEYRATRKLTKVLDEVLAEHDQSGRFPILSALDSLPLSQGLLRPEDRGWMLMYLLWNAVTYLGPYCVWATLDVMSRPAVLRAVRERDTMQFVEHCMFETLRGSPVSSLVRHTDEPLNFEHEGKNYTIPAGGYVGTLVWALHQNAETYEAPETYDPWRYERGEPIPSAFGRGAFGCVATRFIRTVMTNIITFMADRYDLTFESSLPEKVVRIHLLAPHSPIRAQVTRRPEVAETYDERPEPAVIASQPISKCPFHQLFQRS